jgi:hypothetical protein
LGEHTHAGTNFKHRSSAIQRQAVGYTTSN